MEKLINKIDNINIKKTQSYIDPKHKSSLVTFKDIFPSGDRNQHDQLNSVVNDSVANFKINLQNDESIKQISASLATLEKISKIKLTDIDSDELNNDNKEDENWIMQREHGNTKRSTILLKPTVFGKVSGGTLSSDAISTVQVRVSDNVAVRNMPIDSTPSKDLPTEEADAYASIIEKLLDQLELIKYTIPAEVNDKWDESWEWENGNYDEFHLLSNENVDSTLPNSSIMEKLQRDRTYIYNVLKEIAVELRLRRRYDRLEKEIDNIVKTSEIQHNLEINYQIWKEQLAQLNQLVVNEKTQSESHIKTLLASVHKSGTEIENAIFSFGSKLGYMEKWEQARLDQQKLLLEIKEQELHDKLTECMKKEKIDDTVSSELRVFYHNDITKMEEEIEIWSRRYDDEMEQSQREIDYFNERIKDVKEALEEKYQILNKRQAFIEEYENEKRTKAKEAEYWTAIHRAATIIQSLWKGYMVRHQLGQYKRLWAKLKKRKRLAAKLRKKRKARLKKKRGIKKKKA